MSDSLRRRVATVISAVAAAAAILAPSVSGEPSAPLRLGMSRSMISGLTPSDAKITLGRIMAMTGLGTAEFQTRIFESDDQLLDAVGRGEIDFFPIYTLNLIAGRNLEIMDPVVAPSRDGTDPRTRYVLLAHRDHPAKGLPDFRKPTLHFQKSLCRDLDGLWLDVILGEAGLPDRSEFFGTQTEVSSAGRAVTAAFFRKADLCLTTIGEWRTLAELNPQLARQLRPVAVSQPLLTNVICFSRSYQAGRRDIVVAEMLEMHETPKGRQLLTIAQTDRMMAFQPGSLNSLIQLRERHRKVMAARVAKTDAETADGSELRRNRENQ